ncbi:MAG: transglutaminase domain-containing protein, partial [Oscillospiraceae bacterium]|nr:transglutaminase domain-containing protein [Oscillospiraceae bacterium]
ACASAGADEIDLTELDAGEMSDVDLGFLIDDIIPLAGAPAISLLLLPEASGKMVKSNSSAVIDYSNT